MSWVPPWTATGMHVPQQDVPRLSSYIKPDSKASLQERNTRERQLELIDQEHKEDDVQRLTETCGSFAQPDGNMASRDEKISLSESNIILQQATIGL